MKKEMKKVFFVLLTLSISLSYPVVMAEQTRDLKIIKPESGTLGADFSGIWEGSLTFKAVGRNTREDVKSLTVVVEEISPPKIKGLYLYEGIPPFDIKGEIRDPKTVIIVFRSGATLTLSLVSDNSIRAVLTSNRPGPPAEGILFRKK